MAAAPPPSSPGDLLAPGIPSPPPATPSAVLVDIRSDKKVPNEVPGDLIPQRLQHGGVGRVADSGLEGIEKQDSEEPMDGQADVDGDDLQSDMDGAGRKRKQCKNLPPPDRKRHKKTITKSDGPGDGQEDVNNDNTLIKSGAGSKKKRGKNLVVEQKQRNTPITKVVTSPGVNVLMSSTMLKRAVSLANSTRRARTAGSAEILPTQRAQVCPTLQDLSPSTRAANSHASTRRRRKLISSIWREAMPIYKDRRLVEGICNYCRQVFPASRDTGTSHILRHLKQPRPVINGNVEVLKDLTRKIRKKTPNVAPRITSPRVTTSPGVNMLMRTATLKRASPLVRHGSSKKSKMAGSPHSPSDESQSSPPQLTPISPTLADLSPGGRTPTPHGRSNRPRKLVSHIWKEVEPIYEGKRLVKGRCIHCEKIFPASRDSGSSHIGRHLKVEFHSGQSGRS